MQVGFLIWFVWKIIILLLQYEIEFPAVMKKRLRSNLHRRLRTVETVETVLLRKAKALPFVLAFSFKLT